MSSQLAPEIVYRKLQLVIAASIQATQGRPRLPPRPERRGREEQNDPPPTRQTEGPRPHPQPRNQRVRAAQPWPGHDLHKDRAEREDTEGLSTGDAAELKRLRAENAQLRMERDVLKRSVVLWVKEATK
jgi:hypothetical protein